MDRDWNFVYAWVCGVYGKVKVLGKKTAVSPRYVDACVRSCLGVVTGCPTHVAASRESVLGVFVARLRLRVFRGLIHVGTDEPT